MYGKYTQKYLKNEIIILYFYMGCSKCKKKKMELDEKDYKYLKGKNKSLLNGDKVITWVLVGWFFLGLYGLWSLVKDLIGLL